MEKTSERNRIFILSAIVTILLIIFTIVGSLQLRSTYTDQMIGMLGILSQESEIPKEKLDTFLSGNVSDRDYKRGIELLDSTGYSQSGIPLIRNSIGQVSIINGLGVTLLLILIFSALTISYQNWMKFLKVTVDWIRHLDHTELEKNVINAASPETRELIYALQEHRRLDTRERQCLDLEKKKTIAFVEDISHQLKTPLTIMRMHIEKMNFIQEFSQSSLNKAMNQVDKMVLLISMMMKVGMLNSGKSKMEMRTHKVWELAQEISEEFESIYESKQVKLTSEVKGNSSFYYDDYWMKEAVENLVKNCLEYSEPEGMVTIVYHVGTSGLHIAVKDQGKGIEEQNLAHIFERFTSSFRQNDSSSGLGLSIAKQVVEAHFGKIGVDNNKEGGVTFSIYLPLLHGKEVYQDTKMKGGEIDESLAVG
ncbi:MAG TPA: HAMP domain-containing histidine kinase [Candidatus Pelethocola excrementipullorum]|nr:HAMP domain-containing histidine kinase [Candidatus Pelethocola excrementipullorum]